MLNSPILEVAFGLAFTFLIVSLFCGLVTEAMATILQWRARTLLSGLQDLLNDQKFDGLARILYNNALIHPRGAGTATTAADVSRGNPPAYIDPRQFAQAFLDAVAAGKNTISDIEAAIRDNPLIKNDRQLRGLLNSLIEQADGKVHNLRQNIGSWFDAAMDRVSGSYKRRAQLCCFLCGLAVAGMLNIDALQIAKALWLNPAITKMIPAAATDLATGYDALQKLPLPIGWGEQRTFALTSLPGWLLTALATLLGASFWFDALANLLKLRGTGPKPKT